MPSATQGLDRVIDELAEIVSAARSYQSEIGIFPAMYRSVTIAIDGGIRAGRFDDPETLEALAVVFADRYLDAHRAWVGGRELTNSWRVAFEAATDGKRRTAAQHLLAGMNAHINLDLGVAAWEVSPSDPAQLHDDFFRVNDILFNRLDANQAALSAVSGRMSALDRLGGRFDEWSMALALREARDGAWGLTESLAASPDEVASLVTERDRETAAIGSTILGDSIPVRLMASLVSRTDGCTVVDVIDAFVATSPDLGGTE